jgi:hypothetical protein
MKGRSTWAAASPDLAATRMTHDETQRYWQAMCRAMERAGDTTSAIYKRALAITQGRPDPIDTSSKPGQA